MVRYAVLVQRPKGLTHATFGRGLKRRFVRRDHQRERTHENLEEGFPVNLLTNPLQMLLHHVLSCFSVLLPVSMTEWTRRRTRGSPNVQSSPTGSRSPIATGESEPFLNTTASLGATTSPLPPSQDMVRGSERWKKSAQEAAMRARAVEAALEEANQSHEADRRAFEERVARLERQVSKAERRANDSEAKVTQIIQESALDVARRARSFEADLVEANRTHAAEQVAFKERAAQLERQVSEAERRAKDSEAKVTQTTKEFAQDAARRARSFEATLAKANQSHEADRLAFEERVAQLERQVSEAEYRVNDSEARVTQITQELHQTKIDQQQMAALLDTRSAELRDAQVYLTGVDDATDMETLRLVERMNSKIFQLAASIADAFQSRYGEQKDIRVSQEAAARVRHLFGNDLFHALSSIDHPDDSLIVQIALQALMVSYTKWLCATWDFDVTGPQQVLQKLYGLIRRTGAYFAAG